MAYCVEADLDKSFDVKRVTQFTIDDPAANPAVRNSAIITSAIAAADAVIDDTLRDQYAVPFDPVPAAIKQISIWLALYNLASRRDTGISPAISARAAEARARLAAIANGSVTLAVSSSEESTLRSTTTELEPVFTRSRRRADGTQDGRPGSTEVW